jgi:glycogen debranching enzyme
LSLVPKERLIALLQRLLSETEFLSKGGIRALSKYHEEHPYSVDIDGTNYSIQYDPGDSTSDFFGGNSNWRGPVWIPINYIIIQSIKKYGEFYDGTLTIEYPTGSGKFLELEEVALELTKRVVSLFELDEKNERRLHGNENWFYSRPENKNLVLFYEYFHGDTGARTWRISSNRMDSVTCRTY